MVAQRGKRLEQYVIERLHRMVAIYRFSIKGTARNMGLARNTVRKYVRQKKSQKKQPDPS